MSYQSTITEKMAAVHIPCNALRSKMFKKANGWLSKGRFVYSAKIPHHYMGLVPSLFSSFQLTLAMHRGKILMPPSFP